MSVIQITNHGALILSTNYWESDLAQSGKVFCSVNAGAIRILLPPSRYADLTDMRTGKYCILSRGPWPDGSALSPRYRACEPEGIEIIWEDESESPYALHLTPESFDLLPSEPEAGREWVCAVYLAKDGKPHKSLERICYWRRVDRLPWMKPWKA